MSELLACAVKELCPQTQLVGGGVTHDGFYYDFQTENCMTAEFLIAIEERMKYLLHQEVEIKQMEMVPFVAGEYLRSRGEPFREVAAREAQGQLLTLIQIGQFVDYVTRPFAINIPSGTAFKLNEVTPGDSLRICGMAFPTNKDLKEGVKRKKEGKKFDHKILGEKFELFSMKEHAVIWLPKGEELYHSLIEFWRMSQKERGYQLVKSDLQGLRMEKCAQSGRFFQERNEIRDGLFNLKDYWRDFSWSSLDEKELISSLKFIEETYNILGLHYRLVLTGDGLLRKVLTDLGKDFEHEISRNVNERLSFRLLDVYGIEWEGPFIEVQNRFILTSLYGRLEQLIALLIEKKRELYLELEKELSRKKGNSSNLCSSLKNRRAGESK